MRRVVPGYNVGNSHLPNSLRLNNKEDLICQHNQGKQELSLCAMNRGRYLLIKISVNDFKATLTVVVHKNIYRSFPFHCSQQRMNLKKH